MAANRIVIKGDPIVKEAITSGAVTPGMLLERTTTADTVQAHSTSGGDVVPKMFAVHQDYFGEEISSGYADGDKIKFVVARPGDEINALLTCGAAVFSGAQLVESDGAGYLQKYTAPAFSGSDISGANHTDYVAAIVGQVITKTSGAAGSHERVIIEVI